MTKRLLIDLNKCDDCEKCGVTCTYFYRPAAADHGALKLRELVTFAALCRRCEDPNCVAACKFDALERQEDGVLKRYNMRCVACKCCAHACPFGTIYPDTLPFFVTHCDFCMGADPDHPPCVSTCGKGGIEFREVDESAEADTYIVSERLAVRAPKWEKENV
jgi:Fe-S-cluster-containing dehydrogenase component